MKRILHVIHSLTGGGAAREMIYLARYSEDSEGYHHVVATLRPSTEGGLALARDYDLSVIETPPNDRLRREIEKADIVQVNWWNNPEITAFLHSHMPDSRLVIRYHVSGDKPPHCIVREHLEMADANVISYRDLPLLSGFSESWKRDRVSFILHGTDFKRLGNIGPRTHHTFNVGYIGTVSFVKMHPDYVPMSDAIDIPEVRFVICGEVQDKSLMRQVLHRKADHKFDFKGYVNDIAEIVAEMDVFGYPLCEDTYASTDLVLQEVMYAGIPAVVFPHGGLLQTVKDGHNGIVVSTAEQYKEAIEFLYANPAERDRLGKNAKAYVERHLGIENTVNQYHGIYRKLLEQPKVHHAWGKDHDTPLLQQSMAYQDITGDWPQESAAQLFLDSLGQHAGAFEQSMHCERLATCFEADTELSQSSDLLFLDGILKYRAFDPHDPYLNYWAGLVFKDRQSPNQAITCWMNAHGQGFGHWRLYLYLANALQAVGKKGDGRKIWEYLLKIRPDFEKEVEAIAPQKLALEGPPKAPLTHAGHCQRPDKARGNGNSGTHPTPPEEMYQALQPLIIEGKEEELARGLEALLELYPSFALAHNDLGVLSLNRGEKERALRHYEKAVGIEPENMVFQKNLAELYSFGLGRVEEAVQIYKKILASHPEDVETLLAMGHICKAVNHLKDALFFYEKAMEVSEEMRNSREAVLNLGSICTSLEEREKARQVYLSLLSKNMEDEAVILAWESLKDREEDKEIEELVTAEKRDYLVSAIVSTYNSEEFMAQCLENLEAQTISQQIQVLVIDAASPQNERRIVKDFQKRYSNITYVRTKGRIGIYTAWNLAAQMASGTYCMTVSTNDHLRKDACEVLARALDANPDAMLVYGDTYLTETPHETFDRNTHYGAYCWPPYSFEALLHNCMVGPHPMWRTSVHEEIGHFDDRYVTVADQEFWLRMGERHNLLHIPEFTGLQWITPDAISRKGALPSLEIAHIHGRYQKRHASQAHATKKCSIIIPAFNQLAYTKQCLEGLFKNTPEEMYELIVVDNGSTDGTKAFLTTLGQRATVITNGENLGFARACNQGARAASGKYLIFLNNDTLPLSRWLEEMVELSERDETVGIVGSKLLFPDGTIQHAGVVVSANGLPYHLYRGCPGDMPRANEQRSFQIVTAACMLIGRDLFFDIKGFDEGYVNGCEDIDLCLKVGESKRRVVYNPKSVLVHFEGKTEGRQDQMDHNKRLLLKTWGKKVRQDDVSYLQQDGMALQVDGAGNFTFAPSSQADMPIKTSIIIVTYNSLADIRKCVDSIVRHTSFPYEIIVVDNVSSDGTQDYLKTLKRAKVILNATNNGFSRGCNQGIAQARGDYIVLLNPDTMVTQGWDGRLMAHFQESVGAVGPVSNYVAGLQKVELYSDEKPSGHIDIKGLQDSLYQRNRGRSVETKLLIGFCFMIKREVIEDVGMLDEDLFLGNDDLELSLRLRNKGHKLLVATDTFVYHKGQASFQSEPSEKTKRLVQESTDALYRKLQDQYGRDQVPSPQTLWGIDWFKPSAKAGRKVTSIVILAHNQLPYTKKCISSIFKYTKQPFELIVVDNASSDGTMKYLGHLAAQHGLQGSKGAAKASPQKGRRKKGRKRSRAKKSPSSAVCKAFKVIRNDRNLGFAAGNNQGMAMARGDYVLLMNNDIVVTPGWLDRMIACAERSPTIGMVGPMSNYVSGPQLVQEVRYNTKTLARLNTFAKEFAETFSAQSTFIWRVVGFCMLIKRVVVEKIGGMDDRYGLGNFEDDDFSLRAALAGFESWIAKDCFVHHFGSRTFIGAKIDYQKSLHRNWEIFKQKWGLPEDLPYGSPYTIAHIPNHGFDPTKHFFPIDGTGTSSRQQEPSPPACLDKDDGPSRVLLAALDPNTTASIIIPVSRRQGELKTCVESIQNHTNPSYEMILVNPGPKRNASTWLKETVRENSSYRLVETEKGATLARCYNDAMKAARGKHIVLLDSRTVVSEGWLSGMLDCMGRVPHAGIVGPMTNKAGGVQHVAKAHYGAIDGVKDFTCSFKGRNQYRRIPTTRIDGFCMVFHRSLLEKVGSFDESLGTDSSEMDDFCLRATLEGHTNLIAGDVFVHHDSGKSALGDNRGFTEKWSGIDPQTSLGKKLLALNALEKASELSERGELENAVRMLVQGMRHTPYDKKVYFALAETLMNNKQYKDALGVVRDIPSDEEDVRKLELTACCMEGMERFKEADTYVERILALDASSPPALNLRGLSAARQGDKAQAAIWFDRAMASDPGYGPSYTNLGRLKWDMGHHQEALPLFEKGFVLEPTAMETATVYHVAVTELKAFKIAEPLFAEAQALHPANKRITYLLIDILIKQGKYDLAMEEIEKAMVAFAVEDGFLSAALQVRGLLGPKKIEEPSNRGGTISLCMIVKNEEHHLARCLSSLTPVVDEIIIVDTGSTDRTKEMATLLGARVFDFEWSDDFAAARNLSISKASGDWILVMDADEVISPLDYDSLRRLVNNATAKPTAYSVVTRNYSTRTNTIGWTMNDGAYGNDEAGAGWMPSVKVRLFPNDSRIRFDYPVHERVEPSLRRAGVKIKRCPIPVHHYGQLDQEKRDSKGASYYELGMKKLNERGDDVEAIHELAVQAGCLGKHEDAIDLWQRLLAIKPRWPIAFVNMGTAYLKLGKYDDALRAARKGVELAPQMKEAVNNYALCKLYVGKVKETIGILEGLLEKEPGYLSAQFILAVAYCCKGRKEAGLKAFERLKPKVSGPGLAVACHDLAKRLLSADRRDDAMRLLSAAIEGRNVNEDVMRLLDECRDMRPAVASPVFADASACA